jgi:hypothetical protein
MTLKTFSRNSTTSNVLCIVPIEIYGFAVKVPLGVFMVAETSTIGHIPRFSDLHFEFGFRKK